MNTESTLREIVKQARDEAIMRFLDSCNGNRTKAAIKMGISRTALLNNLKRMRREMKVVSI